MIWTTLIVSLLIAVVPGGKTDVVGTYSISKKGANNTSWSTTTLELNCDSTVSIDLRTHGGLTRWDGIWRTHNDTLTINLKPIITEDGKEFLGSWENVNRFLIGKSNLTPIVTKINGEEIKDDKLLKDLNRNLKEEKYKKIRNKSCS